MSVVANRDRDCFSCRMVSGSGLIGIGGYLAYHARNNSTTAGKLTISTLALTFMGLGVARCGQFYPFDRSTRNTQA